MDTGKGAPAIPPTRPGLVVLATLLGCLPLLALSQFIAHTRVDEFDSWLFAYYGRELLAGRTLYRDLWDNKPPGIFWLNALGLWFGRGSLVGVWALCALAVCAAAALVFAAAKRLYGWSAAGIAAVLGALYLNIYPYHVGCDRPSTFLATTELACFALYCTALTARRACWALLMAAGFCGGLGPCLHQAGLGMSVAAMVHSLYLAVARRISWPSALGRILLFSLGWCSAVGAAIGALYATSDPAWAWDAIVGFNRLCFSAGDNALLVPRFFAVEEHRRVMGLPMILAAATLLQPILRRVVGGARAVDDDPHGRRPDGLLMLLWAWMLAAVYLALLGPNQRLHYFGVALPPLAMLAAHGVYLLLRSGRRMESTRPAYHIVVGVLWFGYMMIWPVHEQIVMAYRQHYHYFEEPPNPTLTDLLAGLRRHTASGDAIFVWGYGPKLYWDAERRSAIRYIGTEKLDQLGAYGSRLMDEIARLLMEANPKAIVADGQSLSTAGAGVLNDWLRIHYAHPPDYPYENLWIREDEEL